MEAFQELEVSDDIWDDISQAEDSGAEAIVVLKAYIDASTRKDSGLLSVAGYLFESGRTRRFRQQWRDIFGNVSFSWAELANRADKFRHLQGKDHDAEHARLVSAGVALVREHIIAGALASCWMLDVENYGPTWIKGFAHAYSIAGHMTMWGIGRWARLNNYKGGIQYVIEAGDDGYDQLDHLLSYMRRSHQK